MKAELNGQFCWDLKSDISDGNKDLETGVYNILERNVFAFCSCPETLCEGGFI